MTYVTWCRWCKAVLVPKGQDWMPPEGFPALPLLICEKSEQGWHEVACDRALCTA